MSYTFDMQELRFKPVAFWRLDGSSPYTDYSGYANSATLAGTDVNGIPLTSSASVSQLFDANRVGTFACPVFKEQSKPFSISLTLYPIFTSDTGSQAILSHSGKTDGIRLTGDVLSFTTKYTSQGEATCFYQLPQEQKFNIVVIHTNEKNSLYVNNELVDEVEITTEQQADSFDIASTNLVAGTTVSTKGLFMNNVALYYGELSSEQIEAIHNFNNRIAVESVPTTYGGQVVAVGTDNRVPAQEYIYNTAEQWNTGLHQLTTADGNRLEAQKDDDGLSIESSWVTAISFISPEPLPNLRSSYLWWSGSHALVEVSVDGITWTIVERGQELTAPAGGDVNGASLYIRVSFEEGNRDSYLDYIRLRTFYTTTAQTTLDSRLVTYTAGATVHDKQTPHWLKEDWGVVLDSTGGLSIEPRTGGETIRTLEFWVKPVTTYTTNRTGTTTYVNGIAGASVIAGAWNLVHIVSTGGWTTATTFGSNQQIGQVAYYETALSAPQITDIVAAYTGVVKTYVSGSGALSLVEPVAPTSIYDHDWSRITPGG